MLFILFIYSKTSKSNRASKLWSPSDQLKAVGWLVGLIVGIERFFIYAGAKLIRCSRGRGNS